MEMCSLPPDLVIGNSVDTTADLWHLPTATWSKIWAKTTGRTVKYGNIDTGYAEHPDLPKPVNLKSFVNESGIDGNSGHGPHTIGTSIGHNGIGVAPGAILQCVGQVLSPRSGSGGSDGIAASIRWCADQGCDVVSASLGGGGAYEPTRKAIEYLNSKGGLFVAAAGNAGFNGANTIGYPAKFFESLCIGATKEDGGIASFSSGGREIDCACPGQNIISANYRGGRIAMSGTSMATPFFSGLACLIIELVRREGHGNLLSGIDAWRMFLSKFSEDKGTPGHDERFGHGIPRADKIVEFLAADDVTSMSTVTI